MFRFNELVQAKRLKLIRDLEKELYLLPLELIKIIEDYLIFFPPSLLRDPFTGKVFQDPIYAYYYRSHEPGIIREDKSLDQESFTHPDMMADQLRELRLFIEWLKDQAKRDPRILPYISDAINVSANDNDEKRLTVSVDDSIDNELLKNLKLALKESGNQLNIGPQLLKQLQKDPNNILCFLEKNKHTTIQYRKKNDFSDDHCRTLAQTGIYLIEPVITALVYMVRKLDPLDLYFCHLLGKFLLNSFTHMARFSSPKDISNNFWRGEYLQLVRQCLPKIPLYLFSWFELTGSGFYSLLNTERSDQYDKDTWATVKIVMAITAAVKSIFSLMIFDTVFSALRQKSKQPHFLTPERNKMGELLLTTLAIVDYSFLCQQKWKEANSTPSLSDEFPYIPLLIFPLLITPVMQIPTYVLSFNKTAREMREFYSNPTQFLFGPVVTPEGYVESQFSTWFRRLLRITSATLFARVTYLGSGNLLWAAISWLETFAIGSLNMAIRETNPPHHYLIRHPDLRNTNTYALKRLGILPAPVPLPEPVYDASGMLAIDITPRTPLLS